LSGTQQPIKFEKKLVELKTLDGLKFRRWFSSLRQFKKSKLEIASRWNVRPENKIIVIKIDRPRFHI